MQNGTNKFLMPNLRLSMDHGSVDGWIKGKKNNNKTIEINLGSSLYYLLIFSSNGRVEKLIWKGQLLVTT